MAKDTQSPPDKSDKNRPSEPLVAVAASASSHQNSTADGRGGSVYTADYDPEHPTAYYPEIESSALIKTEIRIICFLDLVHNFFMICTLIYTIVVVAIELDKLIQADHHFIDLNGFELPEFCLYGVCGAILLHILMLFAGMCIVNQIRRGTFPILINATTVVNMDTTSRNYLFVNGILVFFGFICNILLLIYFPYPEYSMGVVYLFSNCFRTMALVALRSLIALLSKSSNDILLKSAASHVREIPSIITTSPSPEKVADK